MPKYKKRKDGRYLVQIQIGFQDDGKPKYKNLYGRTIPELDKKVTMFKADLYKGIIVDDKGLTLKKWAEHWLETYKSGLGYSAKMRHRAVISNHLADIAHMKIGKLKTNFLQELINEKSKERSVKEISQVLNGMLQQAVENELIHKNPMNGVIIPTAKTKERRALTQIERNAIETADLTAFERTFIYICLYAGLRRGEALALMRNDIDFDDGIIRVRRTLELTKSGYTVKDGTKTKAGMRDVPIIEPLKSALQAYVKQLDGMYLFTNKIGGIIANQSFDLIWKKIMKKLNAAAKGTDELTVIKDITPHYLRHTFATDLYYAGVDIKACQYLLGHSSIKMTMDLYTHLENDNADITKKLQNYISKISHKSVKSQ